MEPRTLPDDVWIEAGPKMLMALLDGDDIWHMIVAHWQGESLRSIADRYDTSHVNVSNWIRRAKVKLRQAGLNPDAIQGYAHRHAATESQVR